MAGTFKSVTMMRGIKEGVQRRLPTFVLTSSADSNGNPLMLIASDSSPATTKQVAMVRVSPIALVMTNSIGGTQENMCPHLVEIALEAGTGTGLTASTYLSLVNSTAIVGELMKQGGIYTAYLLANGTVPALANVAAQMVSTTQVATFELDVANRLSGA